MTQRRATQGRAPANSPGRGILDERTTGRLKANQVADAINADQGFRALNRFGAAADIGEEEREKRFGIIIQIVEIAVDEEGVGAAEIGG